MNDYRSVGQRKWEKSQKETPECCIQAATKGKPHKQDQGGKYRPAPNPGTAKVSMEHCSGKKEHRWGRRSNE